MARVMRWKWYVGPDPQRPTYDERNGREAGEEEIRIVSNTTKRQNMQRVERALNRLALWFQGR